MGRGTEQGNQRRNSGLQNQAVLYVRDSLNGPERVLIDPNSWSKDGADALAELSVSSDGKRIAYAVQEGGGGPSASSTSTADELPLGRRG